jgi:hypothetical protein
LGPGNPTGTLILLNEIFLFFRSFYPMVFLFFIHTEAYSDAVQDHHCTQTKFENAENGLVLFQLFVSLNSSSCSIALSF